MERIVLVRLHWRLHAPTAAYFVHQIIDLLPFSSAEKQLLVTCAEEYVRFVSMEAFFLSYDYSVLGVAAVISALEGLGVVEIPAWLAAISTLVSADGNTIDRCRSEMRGVNLGMPVR